jgi:hypothetical protein
MPDNINVRGAHALPKESVHNNGRLPDGIFCRTATGLVNLARDDSLE